MGSFLKISKGTVVKIYGEAAVHVRDVLRPLQCLGRRRCALPSLRFSDWRCFGGSPSLLNRSPGELVLHLEVLEITCELTLLEVRKDPIRQSLMPEDSVLLSGYYWDLPSIVRLILGQLWFLIYSLVFYIYVVFVTSFYTIIWARAFSMMVSDVHMWKWKYHLGTGVFKVVISVITTGLAAWRHLPAAAPPSRLGHIYSSLGLHLSLIPGESTSPGLLLHA